MPYTHESILFSVCCPVALWCHTATSPGPQHVATHLHMLCCGIALPFAPVTGCRAKVTAQAHVPHADQAEVKAGHPASARPSPSPLPSLKRECRHSPATRKTGNTRIHTPPRARSHDENKATHGPNGQTASKLRQACASASVDKDAATRPLGPSNKCGHCLIC